MGNLNTQVKDVDSVESRNAVLSLAAATEAAQPKAADLLRRIFGAAAISASKVD